MALFMNCAFHTGKPIMASAITAHGILYPLTTGYGTKEGWGAVVVSM